jgi:HEAT repeat protein
MGRRWLRTNTLMLMVLVAILGVFFGVVKRQQAGPGEAAAIRLRGGDVSERLQAAYELSLKDVAAELAIPALIEALNDRDEDIRWAAAYSLGCRGAESAPAVAALVRLCKDPSIRLRRGAVDTLGLIRSGAAVPGLVAALKDPDETVRLVAAQALGTIGPGAAAATAALVAVALDTPDARLRAQAFASLNQIGAAARDAVPTLIRALGRTDSTPAEVRWSILKALRAVAPDDAESVRARLDALHDADEGVRAAAAGSLDTPISDRVVAALIEALHSDAAHAAAESLGRMGLDHPAIVPALCQATGASPGSRIGLGSLLIWFNPPKHDPAAYRDAIRRAVPALCQAVATPDRWDRNECIWVLSALLVWAQECPDPEVRAALPPGVHAILRGLDDGDPMTRVNALQHLWRVRLQRPAIVRAVVGLIDRGEQPVDVRRNVLHCLEHQLREPDPADELRVLWGPALSCLIRFLDDSDDPSRRSAVRILMRLGPRARPALGRLRRLASEEAVADIRAEAESAVPAITTPDQELPVAAGSGSP